MVSVGSIVGGFMDMFAYTAMLIPIMNGILYVIGMITDNFIKKLYRFIHRSWYYN
jgi:hypothetical protein